MFNLLRDKYGVSVQAFPLIEGQISVTSTDGNNSDGVFSNIHLIYCVEDGGFTVTFKSGGTKAVTMTSNDIFSIIDSTQIDITSGTFHVA